MGSHPFRSYNVHFAGECREWRSRRRTETARRRGRNGEGTQRRERERKSERCGPRQRDIVQIAESGDIDHRGAAAAEPSGTDTSDLSVPLEPLLPPPLSPSPSSLTFLFCEKTRFLLARLLHVKNLFHSNRRIFEILSQHDSGYQL